MKPLVLTFGALCLAVTALAQTARQGSDKADPTEFHSPMVLETEFVGAKPFLWQEKDSETWVQSPEYAGLRKYHCDGVSIWNLQLSPVKSSNDSIVTQIKVWVANTGHDKRVKLLFELFNGEVKVADTVLGPFKDKEGATVIEIVPLVASKANLVVEPLTKLRITMTNWDY